MLCCGLLAMLAPSFSLLCVLCTCFGWACSAQTLSQGQQEVRNTLKFESFASNAGEQPVSRHHAEAHREGYRLPVVTPALSEALGQLRSNCKLPSNLAKSERGGYWQGCARRTFCNHAGAEDYTHHSSKHRRRSNVYLNRPRNLKIASLTALCLNVKCAWVMLLWTRYIAM